MFNEFTIYNYNLVIFSISAIILCILMLMGGWLLGGRSSTNNKNIPFESGINSVGSARLCLSINFYLIAMFFVIFDVEALYLFAWSISIREGGVIAFYEATVFILTLLVSLFYLIRIGAFSLNLNLKNKVSTSKDD